MVDEDEFLRRLRALGLEYLESLDARTAPIRRMLEPGGVADESLRDGARRAAHGIAGTAESFGFCELGTTARQLEKALDDATAPSARLDGPGQAALERLGAAVVGAVDALQHAHTRPRADSQA